MESSRRYRPIAGSRLVRYLLNDQLLTLTRRSIGNGARACIGRGFAWQESLLIVAMVSTV